MPKEVLIIRFSALGDVAITLPLLRSLVEAYPDVHFRFLSKSFTKELFEEIEGPNFQFIGADVRKRHKGIFGLIRLYREENLVDADVVCDLHANSRSRFLRFLLRFSGVNVYKIDKQRKARRRLVRRRNKLLLPVKPVLEQYKEVLGKAGLVNLKALPISSAKKSAYQSLAEKEYGKKECSWIGIAPFAKHQGKIYPLHQMEEVVSHFAQAEHCRLFLFGGGASEMAVFEQWKKSYPALNIASGKGLKKDLEIMSALDVLLTMDSANMHLASMMGTETVSIWGATHYYSGFFGIGHKAANMLSSSEDLPCRPCSIYGNRPCYRGDYACMTTIQPSQIIHRIEAILSNTSVSSTSLEELSVSTGNASGVVASRAVYAKKKTSVHPDFAYLSDFIEQLDSIFDKEGRSIYRARNEIKVFERNGLLLNVKCFKKPLLINQFVYAHLRYSKACRSYNNALRLLQLGIETPTPVGYLECISGQLLKKSYYVSIHLPYSRTLKEFADNSPVGDRKDIVEALGRYIAKIHQANILHKDLSPGNILFEKDAQGIHFSLVDINRMAFCKIFRRKGYKNMERLRGSEGFFRVLAQSYAEVRNYPVESSYREILRYNRQSVKYFTQKFNKKERRKQAGIRPTIGVIISTYNHSDWLQKALWGYACQTCVPDQIIIADDGSSDDTKMVVEAFRQSHSIDIQYVWQEDDGFRKNLIMNKALRLATADYLIFTDQDCLPRYDLVETHLKYAERGYFLSSGYSRLSESVSDLITEDDISSRRAFQLKWLKSHGLKSRFKNLKLWNNPLIAAVMNHITTAKATFNGCNTSCWRSDILSVNGFNEQMGYGGEDREVGERLHNLGIKSKQIRFSAVCLHLYHERPYKNKASIQKNKAIRKNTRKSKLIVTPAGIVSLEENLL